MKIWFLTTLVGLSIVSIGCGRSGDQFSTIMAQENFGQEEFVEIGQTGTILKKRSLQGSDLAENEKCNVDARKKIILRAEPSVENGHYFVKLAELLPDCGFQDGFIFREHVAKSSLKRLFSANMHAFLDMIAYAEGTDRSGVGAGYNIIFSHQTFSSYARHPARLVCSGGYCSDASGRYQIKSDTWGDVRRELGLNDFSPESQDRAAVQLIKWRGGYDDVERIDGPNSFDNAVYTVRLEWASLPHSPYGQPTHSVGELWRKFQQYRARY